jgi:predicted DNA-binding protein
LKVQAKHEVLVVPVRLSRELAGRLDRAVRLLGYGSRSRLMREAIEHYVSEILEAKTIEVRDVSVEEAGRLIEEYLTDNPGVHYVSEISEALGIEFKTAFEAVKMLIRQGSVEVKK